MFMCSKNPSKWSSSRRAHDYIPLVVRKLLYVLRRSLCRLFSWKWSADDLLNNVFLLVCLLAALDQSCVVNQSSFSPSVLLSILQLIQSDLDDDEDERPVLDGGRGTLRFKHKLPVELKGPEGVHVVHGSTGTLLTSDLNSLPEDDQRALARSLETLNADGGLYSERNARTESAKSTPMHRHKDGNDLSETPLEITELWLAEASLVWAQSWLVCLCTSTTPPWQGWRRMEECV